MMELGEYLQLCAALQLAAAQRPHAARFGQAAGEGPTLDAYLLELDNETDAADQAVIAGFAAGGIDPTFAEQWEIWRGRWKIWSGEQLATVAPGEYNPAPAYPGVWAESARWARELTDWWGELVSRGYAPAGVGPRVIAPIQGPEPPPLKPKSADVGVGVLFLLGGAALLVASRTNP